MIPSFRNWSLFLLIHIAAIKTKNASANSSTCFNPSIDSAVSVDDPFSTTNTFSPSLGKCVYAFGPMEYNNRLYPGEFLCDVSPSPNWAFGMKKNYDVVLVNVKTGRERIISDDGKEGSYLRMQGDGNLVLKDRSDRALWKSGTAKNCGAKLYIRCYGEVQIVTIDGLEVLWKKRQYADCIDNYLFYGAKLDREEYICYDNQRFGMTRGGDLVFYDDGELIWSKNTGEDGAKYLEMKSDGDLVVYDGDDDRVWATGTTSGEMNMNMRGASLILDYRGVYIKTTEKKFVFWWEW